MKLAISQEKQYSNIKFNGTPSNGSPAVPCGRTDKTKLTVSFANFADAPNKFVFLAGLFSWCIEVYNNDVYKKNDFFI